jgi:hypothetical protein
VASLFVTRLNAEWRPHGCWPARAAAGRWSRRRVRDRLDAVHRPDAHRDPQRGGDQGHGRRGRPAAGDLLGRPGRPVPDQRGRLQRATTVFRWLRDRYVIITAVSGCVLIAMGVLIFTGEMTDLNIEAQRFLEQLGLDGLYNL